MSTAPFRHTGAQKEVIKLFRKLLRSTKDVPKLNQEVRTEFRKHQDIPKRDFPTIERLIRAGNHRLLEQESNQKATGFTTFSFTRQIQPENPKHKLVRNISKPDKKLR
jgi:succinate dehydrogenase assembly factor 1